MVIKILTPTQKAAAAAEVAKASAPPTGIAAPAAPHSSSTESRAEITTAAAQPSDGRPTTTAPTTTSSPQKMSPVDRFKAPITGAYAAHSYCDSGTQTDSTDENKSAEKELPVIPPTVIKVGLTERYWGPHISPFVKEPAVMPPGRLF